MDICWIRDRIIRYPLFFNNNASLWQWQGSGNAKKKKGKERYKKKGRDNYDWPFLAVIFCRLIMPLCPAQHKVRFCKMTVPIPIFGSEPIRHEAEATWYNENTFSNINFSVFSRAHTFFSPRWAFFRRQNLFFYEPFRPATLRQLRGLRDREATECCVLFNRHCSLKPTPDDRNMTQTRIAQEQRKIETRPCSNETEMRWTTCFLPDLRLH